jgi:hypothetical protein
MHRLLTCPDHQSALPGEQCLPKLAGVHVFCAHEQHLPNSPHLSQRALLLLLLLPAAEL